MVRIDRLVLRDGAARLLRMRLEFVKIDLMVRKPC